MSEIKWVRRGNADWYWAPVTIGREELVLKAFARPGSGCVALVTVFNDEVLAASEDIPTVEAAKARAVEMLREIGTAMVRAAGGAGAKKR